MRILSLSALLLAVAPTVAAQGLYDPTILRTVDLTFHSASWWTLLKQNYQSQTLILADLTMEGIVYPNVGVRIRGNTSYTKLPPGSQKVSLNISMDFVDPTQDLLGYDTLNFNNAFTDPTFCREVAYNNFVAGYMPNGRANHVLLTIGGEDWGVYANVQQFNKDMLREYFDDEDGMRVKCANNPNGPGLKYNGSSPSGYTGYEIKETGGLADPWGELIAVCDAVTNTPLGSWETIDSRFAIDPSIWSVVLENLFTDDDSYVNKGADFVTYRNPVDGRTHLLQTDGNEAWTAPNWSPTYHFSQSSKPVLSHILVVPELRQRYMAHLRSALEEFDWAQLGSILLAHRDMIDAYVLADPKKLYTYTQFRNNFFTQVSLGGGGPGGGNVVGLQQFVDQREALLESNAELMASGPVINWIAASSEFPAATDPVYITADVDDPVASVELFYLPAPGSYARTPMLDDGLSGDGAAGDGVFGALLPITAYAGQIVDYYVAATSTNAYASLSFNPRFTELKPATLNYAFGGSGVRITEYMYSGTDGEFAELTNTTGAPIDLTGWSLDDQSAVPGTFDLSAAGTLAAGESIVVTESTPAAFSAAWGLSGVTVLGPNTSAALGRNDQINLYDDAGELVDRLTYGDESFPGTVRAKEASAQACVAALGNDDPYEWSLAVVGDAWGAVQSSGSDVGSPGGYVSVACSYETYCTAGVSASGCQASLSAVGSASATASSGFDLSASNVEGARNGLFFFGANGRQANPWGNGTSLQCVAPPVSRAGLLVGTGTSGLCDGTFSQDLNALWCAACPKPNKNPGSGSIVQAQLWYRDPQNTSNRKTSFSEALEFSVLP